MERKARRTGRNKWSCPGGGPIGISQEEKYGDWTAVILKIRAVNLVDDLRPFFDGNTV